jgi:hypothetical protein
MKNNLVRSMKSLARRAADSWLRLTLLCSGAAALAWFLIRVIPKPSRATYPCQRAAFPVASAFVIWLTGSFAGISAGQWLRRKGVLLAGVAATVVVVVWSVTTLPGLGKAASTPAIDPARYNWTPEATNQPIGVAKGIHPGRVVWTRDPAATKWAGNWKEKSDQWWLDQNTDQSRVDAMLSATIQKLTNAGSDEQAWDALFRYYNRTAKNLSDRGYHPGEVVAVKINLNNSSANKADNQTDATPQMVLAMVRQLVNMAHVAQGDILVYDARRPMHPYILTKVWSEFKDVRFVQERAPVAAQPKNPAYGDYHGLEAANWVEGVAYSNGKYDQARYIPKQVMDATYLVNLALLKCHSYPYNYMENGDQGQTALTMIGKSHFGSIRGTAELHAAINTDQEATKKGSYSPMVDLVAAPNLGAKTVLYVLDGLYCGRKWRSYPLHFPNPPFNNRVTPYENTDWPACVLASQDPVALDSVGLDIMYSQSKNNNEPSIGNKPRILIREFADDYLHEMALADNPPSGTAYTQGGKRLTSLGVHEHWDSDATMRYSRNLDPVHGKGIELIYLPPAEPNNRSVAAANAGK